jgi:hypothetical protein
MSTKKSDSIMTLLGVTSFPSAAINRIHFPGQAATWIGRDVWGNAVRQVLDSRRSPVTISVQNKVYNKNTKQLSFDVTLFAHQTIPGPVSISIIQTEDSLNYEQHKYVGSTTQYLFPFYHENVFKQVIPRAGGQLLTGINIPTQSTMTNSFSFRSLDSIPANAHIVVLIHSGSGNQLGEVLQSYKEPMLDNALPVDRTEPATSFALLQNYPNPFNPSTVIGYTVPVNAQVSIIVTDVYGRQIRTLVNARQDAGTHSVSLDGSGLTSGHYFVTMRSGAFVQTRTVTLMK